MKNDNGVMMQYFEWYLPDDCTLWKQLKNDAPNLKKNGITAVWMPPAYKGQAGVKDVGYGVYDIYDLGEFDQKGTVPTKYGTRQEYIEAIEALHENGIQAYADIVLNHMMGADRMELVDAVEDASDNHWQAVSLPHMIKAGTMFTFPGRNGKYSDFVWDHNCFSGVDYDFRAHQKAVFNFKGTEWSPKTDPENGNSDYLMGANINFDNPLVVDHLKEWGEWYLEMTHVDGFRLDAVKHIDSDFFPDWLSTMRNYYGEEFFSVGEYWNGDVNVLNKFENDTGRCMSLFDVPLHFNLHHASLSDGNYDMSHLLSGTLTECDPVHSVSFVDNHDTQQGQALESTVAEWFVPSAYAVILLRPQGYPCIFYGDYYGVKAREGRNFRDVINIMLRVRHERMYGIQRDYFDDSNLVGWTMEGDDDHPGSGLAVVMTDRLGGEKKMNVGERHAGEIWTDALGICPQEVVIDNTGTGLFACQDGSRSVWISSGRKQKAENKRNFDD